jgi:hypothetical protein
MKTYKKVFRMLFLILVIALALAGLGLPFINYREKYMDNEIRIELLEKRDDDLDDQVMDVKEKT